MSKFYFRLKGHQGCFNCGKKVACEDMLFGPKEGSMCLEWGLPKGIVVIWHERIEAERPVEAECQVLFEL